jgi:Macrocin-O-methyltransferase (TylF)
VTAAAYLDLLKRCLVNVIYRDPPVPTPWHRVAAFDLEARLAGRDWPSQAHTMIGMRRLDHLQALIEDVLRRVVPGDLLEAGVGRGGTAILMRGVLAAHGIADRHVWAADSYQGFPGGGEGGVTGRSYRSPELARGLAELRADPGAVKELADRISRGTSLAEVRDHFGRYGLLDERVRFLEGWFRDTLPAAPIDRLALLHVDADLYDSTLVALSALHPRLSRGGYVVVDDYGAFGECREAVHDYLSGAGIEVTLEPVDGEAVFWRKGGRAR